MDGVIFDWGGTLSVWAEVDLEDMWRAAARHIAPDEQGAQDDLVRSLIAIENRFWRGVEESQTSGHLSEIFAQAARELDADVADAVSRGGHRASSRRVDTEHRARPRCRWCPRGTEGDGSQDRPVVEHVVAGGVPRPFPRARRSARPASMRASIRATPPGPSRTEACSRRRWRRWACRMIDGHRDGGGPAVR